LERENSPPAAAAEISLALSGGGVRAMAVHMGVLKYMAEKGWLERVARISTVSGGSLAVGLVFASAGRTWPSSQDFRDTVYCKVGDTLCSRSIVWAALWQLCNPCNWKYLLSRANLLENALRDCWGFDFRLDELKAGPVWSINATTAENGKRFRFKGSFIGDYDTGYAQASIDAATALAVSAAFPGLIGPLALKTGKFHWKRRETWGACEEGAKKIKPTFSTLHLYDGGVYDNLGLEPLFDAGRGTSKAPGDVIIISDAGAPLGEGFSWRALNPWRLKRVADIMSEQARSLRVRVFVEYVRRQKKGAYLQMDNRLIPRTPSSAAEFTCSFPTTLRRLTRDEFENMAGHGYAVAQRVHQTYGFGIE
jgi:NTE family protein